MTLAAFRGWPGCVWPAVPQFVSPASRRDFAAELADVRRVERWDQLVVEEGPFGLPILGPLDGLITLAPYVDDGTFHVILQQHIFSGEFELRELMARRRSGLPGSARITRVGEHFQMGLDSPEELAVFTLFRAHGHAPNHLNASVQMPWGLVGPFDGLDDIGSGYEYDGGHHTDDRHLITDPWKNQRAERARLEIVRLISPDVGAREPALAGWLVARSRAASIVRPTPLLIVHQSGRRCPCGYRAP